MLAGLDLSFSLISIFDPHSNSWAVPALDLSRNSAGLVLQGEENGDDDSIPLLQTVALLAAAHQ